MNVLGLKIGGHDPGAALVSKGRVTAMAEERLNRIKHSPNTFPHLSIEYCLKNLGLKPEDIDLVAMDSTTLSGEAEYLPSNEMFTKQTKGTFTKAKLITVNHHDAHAATAFFCSPFDDAAVLVYDGAGSRIETNLGVVGLETETMYRGSGTKLFEISKSIHAKAERRFLYTTGIGKLYSMLSTNYLSLGANNEGKMMGLAAYGDDRILKQFPIERWMTEYNNQLVCNSQIKFGKRYTGLIARKRNLKTLLKTGYWFLHWRLKRAYGTIRRVLARLLGTGMVTNPHIFTPIELPEPARDPVKDKLPDEYYSAIAYAAQRIFEHYAILLGKKLRAITQADNLCVAGGCALNIDANHNFLTKVGFKDIFVQPASSDCGIPLGCALWGYHVTLEQPRNWEMRSASLGKTYAEHDIKAALESHKEELTWHETKDVAKETAKLLSENKIIGWFQGGSEYGPRALGNRSILCDARNPEMKDILNNRVKHREVWRPFAASILNEKLGEWFDIKPIAVTAFMLVGALVHKDKQSRVPSIVHVDGTCRMQTLTEKDNGIYYRLVKEFEAITGVPLILNASYNLGGDPIVESPQDALETFLRTDMDYLVLGNFVAMRKR